MYVHYISQLQEWNMDSKMHLADYIHAKNESTDTFIVLSAQVRSRYFMITEIMPIYIYALLRIEERKDADKTICESIEKLEFI